MIAKVCPKNNVRVLGLSEKSMNKTCIKRTCKWRLFSEHDADRGAIFFGFCLDPDDVPSQAKRTVR
jgi:hypothetical protein